MTPEWFTRIEALFHAALAQPPEQRTRFLEDAEPDASVRTVVRDLLDRDATAPTDPLSARLPRTPGAPRPQTIGRYRLLRELGAGGMGTVFLAERDVDGTAQRVALKLLHGMPTDAGKRRMARERALLAGLNHPQIAGHIDGGETDEGQPYLVMEYVEGLALPEHLATAQPALAQRLQLFLPLCDAVAHAHQRLILHRDIKPSNVIVRAGGHPVLFDFGVGTLLEEERPTAQTGTLAYTPGYGAPEQRQGLTATTATDVFGLGALLFDLLTDARLATLRKGDTPVPAPSLHAPDAARRRALRGDLDRIVRKATAEEPAQRYRAVMALAEDVQRFLDGKPVAAAPDAALYRLRKFVARHRLAVATAAVAVIAAGVFVWRLDAERQRAVVAERIAEREATSARQSRDFLVSVLGAASPETMRGSPITVASLLGHAVKRLESSPHDDPQARAHAWLAIAEVYNGINDPQPGLGAADKALAVPGRSAADIELAARIHSVRGSTLTQLGRYAEARSAYRQLLEARRRQGADARVMAMAFTEYGNAAQFWEAYDESEAYLTQGWKLMQSAPGVPPGEQAQLLITLAMLRQHQADLPGADRYLSQARAIVLSKLDSEDPIRFDLHKVSAQIRNRQGRTREAIADAERALQQAYRLFGDRSAATAGMENDLGYHLSEAGRYRDAVTHLQRARDISRAMGLEGVELAQYDVNLADVHKEMGDYRSALSVARSVLRVLPEDEAGHGWLRIQARGSAAASLCALGESREGWQEFERMMQALRAIRGETSRAYGRGQLKYADALIRAGRLSDAATVLASARTIFTARTDTTATDHIALFRQLALLALAQDNLDEAFDWAERALALIAKEPGFDAVHAAKVRLATAQIAYQLGDLDRARRLVREALPVLRNEMFPDAPELEQILLLDDRLAGD